MKYDFDQLIERRGTECTKWDGMKEVFGRDDLLPMWIADMDFACPAFIIDALTERLQHPVLGYSFPSDSCYEAIIEKAERDYNWPIKKEWILFSNGVVDGIFYAIRGLTNYGSRVIIQEPAYFPFYSVLETNNCQVGMNTMTLCQNHYELDIDDLKKQLSAGADALLLCNPHNPTGRVFTEKELLEIGQLCQQYHCIILSDEIHGDIVLQGKHLPIASLNKDFQQNTITFWAASKTYNTPALRTAAVIIPNSDIRKKYLASCMGQNGGSLPGYLAMEQAFRWGNEYREQLVEYLRKNRSYLKKYSEEKLTKLKVVESEGTYLALLDCRAMGLSQEEMKQLFINQCGLALEDGLIFGPSGAGFWRMNLACPKAYLKKALDQLQCHFS